MPDVNGGYRRDTECEDVAPNGPKVQTYLVRDVVGSDVAAPLVPLPLPFPVGPPPSEPPLSLR